MSEPQYPKECLLRPDWEPLAFDGTGKLVGVMEAVGTVGVEVVCEALFTVLGTFPRRSTTTKKAKITATIMTAASAIIRILSFWVDSILIIIVTRLMEGSIADLYATLKL